MSPGVRPQCTFLNLYSNLFVKPRGDPVPDLISDEQEQDPMQGDEVPLPAIHGIMADIAE